MGRPKKKVDSVEATPEIKFIKYELVIGEFRYAFNGNWWKVLPSAEQEFIELMNGKTVEKWNGY